ncbi:MAG: phosphatase PAP2 family protein [candidate division KSB1 bacterium]
MLKLKAAALLVFIVLVVSSTGFAQNSNTAPQTNPLGCAIKTVSSDVAYVVTSPARLSAPGSIKLLAFSALTAGFILRADDKIDEELALEGYEFSSRPFVEFAKLGQVYDDLGPIQTAIGLSAASFAGGLVLRDKKLLQTSRLLVETSALTYLFTAGGKGLLGRARPYTDHGPRDFDLFKFSKTEDFKSMPSGHVSSAFALMTVIAKQYDYWYVEIPAYTFATSVAFQRMTSRNHWASDAMVGAALGYWIGSTLVRKQRQAPTNCAMRPYFNGNRFGVLMNF